MALEEYHRKRDFKVTPEPKGKDPRAREGWSFCIQKHAATRLHYDFRLELKGVLKSWAVPKGPSFDPADKRLAMATEDHPLEYGDFEGIIPAGEYGGGTVVLWDYGTWEPLEDPHKGYHSGSLKFTLYGEKVHGRWALVKIKGRDARDAGKTWLLIKEKDEHVRPAGEYSVVDERPESVKSGRTLAEIAAAPGRVWRSKPAARAGSSRWTARARIAGLDQARKAAPRAAPDTARVKGARTAALPRTLSPQLATLVTEPPEGNEWLHEMKFDGYRIIARLQEGKAALMSRNAKDWTGRIPRLEEALLELPVRHAILDGEVAVILPNGTTSFQALQNALGGAAEGELAYFIFDLLHLEGRDLTSVPLEERKAVLKQLLGPARPGHPLRYSDHVVGSGKEFHDRACRMELEGIVSKRRDAPYQSGRSRTWLKVKCQQRQEFVIGGYTDPEGSRVGIGALLLGVHDPAGTLEFAGKVGTGFTNRTLEELKRRLTPLARATSPFGGTRIPGITRAHWVEPTLVGEVTFTEWTSDGRLRHPSFQGLREDKRATQVVRERPAPTAKGARPPTRNPKTPNGKPKMADMVAGIKLTNPDRRLFPALGVTKSDLALFYESIRDWVLPHVVGRPLTLVRCPEGVGSCFYMKHVGAGFPAALRRIRIQEKKKVGEYLVLDDLAGLIALVQMSVLEIHTWNSSADALEKPDRVVFDLDPDPSVPWERVVETAHLVRAKLRSLDFESFVKTTGGKGLHVVIPFKPALSWEDSFNFSRVVTEQIQAAAPSAFTTEMSKAKRKNKILIDYMRNQRGNTSVAAYSTRARPEATASVPVTWEELTPRFKPDSFTIQTLPRRLAGLEADPWAGYHELRQTLRAAQKRALGL